VEKIKVTPELQKLLDERTKARAEKNFAESDRLRDEIRKLGYEVKDTPDGPLLEPR
jgi:cysteinyl-tRNA synthetase